MTSGASTDFDVAIVGPGHVGAAAALGFAQAGRSAALIGPFAARRDGRTVAVMGASWAALERLGVTERLADVIAPLAAMRLVDDTGSLFRRPPSEFRAAELGRQEFGWNVETAALGEALMACVAQTPAITRFESPVTGLERQADAASAETVTVTMEGGARVRAKLVVGADGRKSAVRKAAGIGASEWSYPQTALTTIVAHARPHRDVSTEFHTRAGPCTLVPLPGRRSSVVWMVEPAEAERLLALDDEALGAAIEARTHSILGKLRIDGPKGLTPMSGLSVERFTGERIALVGEAAHVFPPIGAQGLNLGIRDVLSLVASCSGDDPGAAQDLRRYESSRLSDVRTRTGAVDALNRSLLADMLPVDLARGVGLLALDKVGPLRRFVMRQGLNPQAS